VHCIADACLAFLLCLTTNLNLILCCLGQGHMTKSVLSRTPRNATNAASLLIWRKEPVGND
jgi:hypothetical protein